MTQGKIKLPPRKWYSLQQAADKLTMDSGEVVTVNDLLHYAYNRKLQICTKFLYLEDVGIKIANKVIKFNENNSIELSNAIKKKEIKEYDTFIKTISGFSTIYGITYPQEFNFKIENKDEYNIHKEKKRIYFGFLSFMLDFIIHNYSFSEDGFYIRNGTFFILPITSKNKTLDFLNVKTDEKTKIENEYLFILHEDLELLKHGKDWLNDKEIKNNFEKILNKGGRPTIKYKDEIVLLAEKIFKAYPEHNRERIKEAILELVNNQNYFNDPSFKINEVTTKKILREKEIGISRGKSTPIRALEQFK